MPSPTISHLICSMALITLIFVMPVFYFVVVENLQVQMVKHELKEVADYVANTIENLYILANSSNTDVILKKELNIPRTIRDTFYTIEILNKSDGSASQVCASIGTTKSIKAYSWLIGGLKVEAAAVSVRSSEENVFVECKRVGSDIYVGISAFN